MTPDEIISDTIDKTANNLIKIGIDGIKDLVRRFRERKIAFVNDKKTIEKVKQDMKSHELKLYKTYLQDKDFQIITLMGITLRRLEDEKEFDRLERLKYKIFSRFDTSGLHIAQAVQSGVLNRYIIYLQEIRASDSFIRERISRFLKDIEKHSCFVKNPFNINEEIQKVLSKIYSNSPEVFVITGMGSAIKNTEDLIQKIAEKVNGYQKERYDRKNMSIAFFHKSPFI